MSKANRILRFLNDESVQASFPYPIGSEQILDKETSVRQYIAYMLDRTNTMFEWHNLPPTIPQYMLELYLQIFGYAAFCSVDQTNPILYPQSSLTTPSGVYIFYGGIGGERDIYYRPRLFTAANPRLKQSIQYPIMYPGDDSLDIPSTPAIIMPNDRNYNGLLPLFNRYASELMENDISVRSAQINARALTAISCTTDSEKESARKFFDDLEAGKLGFLSSPAFLQGIQTSNISVQSSNIIIQLIELQQYLKASWFNELGLNVNFNMKREYMSEEEIAVNTDILLPLVDDMLRCRQEYAELINSVFNLNIEVEKSSAWANKEREETAALAEQEIAGGITPEEVDGGEDDSTEIQQEVQQSEVQSTESDGGGNSEAESRNDTESETGELSGDENEKNESDIGGESAVVVNINIGTAEEVTVDDSEPEAQEKSEESSGQSSVS